MNFFKKLLVKYGILRDTTWDHLVEEAIEIENNPPKPYDNSHKFSRKWNLAEADWSEQDGPVIDYKNLCRHADNRCVSGPSLDKQKEIVEASQEASINEQ